MSGMVIQTQKLYERVLEEFRDRIVAELGNKVEAIIVYGSVARGDSNADSDIDGLIISPHKQAIYDRVDRICSEIDMKYETLTTLTYFTPEEFQSRWKRGEPFLIEVVNEGRAVYGKIPVRRHQRALQVGR